MKTAKGLDKLLLAAVIPACILILIIIYFIYINQINFLDYPIFTSILRFVGILVPSRHFPGGK